MRNSNKQGLTYQATPSRSPAEVIAARAVAVVVGLLALVGTAAWAMTGRMPEWSASALNLIGFLLTGSALVVALLIFGIQRREGRAQTAETTQAVTSGFAELSVQLADLTGTTLSDDMTEASKEVETGSGEVADASTSADDEKAQPVPDEVLESLGISAELFGQVAVYDPANIPVGVLGDLWRAWELDESGDRRKMSGWESGEAVGFRRKGRGNQAWFIRFTDRDQPTRSFLWRVTRGGRGKSTPTAEQIFPH